jgi:hypothetical protein
MLMTGGSARIEGMQERRFRALVSDFKDGDNRTAADLLPRCYASKEPSDRESP